MSKSAMMRIVAAEQITQIEPGAEKLTKWKSAAL